MKVLIVEDERPASQKLIRLLKEIAPTIQVIDVLKSVEQTINWFLENPAPELILMDIQLEDGICFEIFENCKIDTPVIFTTAYDEYALRAFKVNSVDYLVKPIARDELKNAVDKFNAVHKPKTNGLKLESVIKQIQTHKKERFLIKIGEHYRSVPTADIYCFYIMVRNAFIITNTGKSYPIDYSLENIEQLIDNKLFFRINRNIIINYYAIRDMVAYSSNRLKIKITHWVEKEEIIISRERVAAFKEWMDR